MVREEAEQAVLPRWKGVLYGNDWHEVSGRWLRLLPEPSSRETCTHCYILHDTITSFLLGGLVPSPALQEDAGCGRFRSCSSQYICIYMYIPVYMYIYICTHY